MCVKQIIVLEGDAPSSQRMFEVEGTSYHPEGQVLGLEQVAKNGKLPGNLLRFCQSMVLCNDSKLLIDKGRVSRSGLPTEAALKVLNEKIGRYDSSINFRPVLDAVEQYNEHLVKNFKTLASLEFTRDRKSMSVLVKEQGAANNVMFIKGAPDYLLERTDKIMNASGNVVSMNATEKQAL